jgi:nucleoside-diphosphate-sugar epimerase
MRILATTVMLLQVCVTGASGFVASQLVKNLLEKGYEVTLNVYSCVMPTNRPQVTFVLKDRNHFFFNAGTRDSEEHVCTGQGGSSQATAICIR